MSKIKEKLDNTCYLWRKLSAKFKLMKTNLLKNSNILIVDDIMENIQVLAGILSKEGVKISVATNGKQGVETATKLMPDLILMDVTMPEMDGYDACRLLKENATTVNIPIIFLTARVDTEDIIKGFQAGGVDYITKPYNPTELLARVVNHLDSKFAKEEIEKSKEQLVIANRDKDRFLALVSHDLRSPFAGIIGLVDLVVEDFESFDKEELFSYFKTFQTSLRVQHKFLEDLLAWGNFQMGRRQLKMSMLNISELVANNIILLENSANNKSITLEAEIDIKINAFADAKMIPSIVHNLISNSIKFTRTGGTVKILAKVEENDIIISVVDNGVGMEPEQIAKLFRIDTVFSIPGTENEKGSGLGLILCKEMIEINGGKIWAESEEGKGSKLSFTLPNFTNQEVSQMIV